MRKTIAKVFIRLVICILLPMSVAAQQTPDIAAKFNLYGIKKQAPVLFIHFDKNVYSNNENVWFTGYFLNLIDEKAYRTLSVALIKDDDHKVMMDDRFIISNKLAFGNMLIPDSLTAGKYTFIAYTNRMLNGQPDVLFMQPITIKNSDQPSYTASLNPIDTSLTAAQQKVMLLVSFANTSKPPLTVPVSYYVGNSAHPVIKGEVKTQSGQYIFNIPSKLLSLGNNRLHAQLTYNKEIKEITMDLPAIVKPALVKFYPEGGNLVAAVNNTIGWEITSYAGNGLKADAFLYENHNIIDTIQTNSYGFGRFTLTPKAGSNYYVKLYGVNKKDTLYKLPDAINNAPAITIPIAVANNVLIVSVNYKPHEKLHFIVHNYKQLFSDTIVEMKAATQRVRIFLDEMPKGLTQLTITDDDGRPFAERLFFSHYNQQVKVHVNTNLNEYATRQKVSLKLKINSNRSVFPDSGLVSIACVQENRIEIKNQNDIESYFYLKHDLGDLPVKQNYLGNEDADRQFLENILLVKGWSRYTWVDLLKTTPADTLLTWSNLAFKGIVKSYDAAIKKRVEIINLNNPLKVIPTDNVGNFIISDEDMVVMPGKKVRLLVDNDKMNAYQIRLTNPYEAANKSVIQNLEFKDTNVPQQQTTQQMQITGMERAIQIKEVKIKANNDDFFKGLHSPPWVNECGDYVCYNNIFNCRNHINDARSFPPEISGRYEGLIGPYQGCIKITAKFKDAGKFKGIYAAQEFYPTDFSQTKDTTPEYIPTIYWKYLAKITSTNEAEFSFYTNDIPGRFKIVVQGRTANDVIYGEKTINVLKPK
jgi:hypothetical protein